VDDAAQIVCGTGNEFTFLRAPTTTLVERESNALELLRRAIWHLNQQGMTAGRQQNPSGVISTDKLTVQIAGVFRAFDIFAAYDDYAIAMVTQFNETSPVHYVADAGVPD